MTATPVVPLAERLRPSSLDDVVGQQHLTAADGALGRMIASGQLSSMILWGPHGTGKTSIARLLADAVGYNFRAVSAIFSGVADLKKIFAEAADLRTTGRPMLLFVDEIHRFNRAQQDAFLPVVESGTIILVGATTENPSFELNGALLSRCQLYVLKPLDDAALETLLVKSEAALGVALPLTPEARAQLIAWADGDGRFLLSQAEVVANASPDKILDSMQLAHLLQKRAPNYDKSGDGHYGLISALHKAMRGSDADAALYYLARMLTAGEDPLYVLRRMVRFASEDIGLADPQALIQCLAAVDTYRLLGSPEGELAVVQACLYCATAPKSNAVYVAQKAAWSAAKAGSPPPPDSIMNAPTKAMKAIGRGSGYRYDHDLPDAFSGQNYWPDTMAPQSFYRPVDRGHERRIAERMAWWSGRRAALETQNT